MAVANYESTYGHLPPAYVLGPDGRPWHSWRVLILPYLEASDVYKDYRFDEPWDGPNNSKLAHRMPKIFALHGEWTPDSTITNYLAVVGQETAWPGADTIMMKDVTDGTGSTILIVENCGAGVHWMEPRDLSFSEMDFAINSPRGISSKYDAPAVVTLDDAVHRIRPTMKPDVLRALLTIHGGEAIHVDDQTSWEFLPDGRMRLDGSVTPKK